MQLTTWANARCESFIKTLKQEELDGRAYHTMEELERNLEDFIEKVYNQVRLHSALGYRSPVEFEQRLPITERPLAEPAPQRASLSFRRHEEIYPDAC